MAEEAKTREMPNNPNLTVRKLRLDGTERTSPRAASSPPSSPPGLKKTANNRNNCLCSPTTHVGSFRCRHHRTNSGLTRSSLSVGSKLSELEGRTTKMCGSLQTRFAAGHSQGS